MQVSLEHCAQGVIARDEQSVNAWERNSDHLAAEGGSTTKARRVTISCLGGAPRLSTHSTYDEGQDSSECVSRARQHVCQEAASTRHRSERDHLPKEGKHVAHDTASSYGARSRAIDHALALSPGALDHTSRDARADVGTRGTLFADRAESGHERGHAVQRYREGLREDRDVRRQRCHREPLYRETAHGAVDVEIGIRKGSSGCVGASSSGCTAGGDECIDLEINLAHPRELGAARAQSSCAGHEQRGPKGEANPAAAEARVEKRENGGAMDNHEMVDAPKAREGLQNKVESRGSKHERAKCRDD